MRHDLEAHAAAVKAYLELCDDDETECVCEDCVVRTILEAAYPHLRTLVLTETIENPGEARAVDLSAVDPIYANVHRLHGE